MNTKLLSIAITIFYGFAFLQTQTYSQYSHPENNLFQTIDYKNGKDLLHLNVYRSKKKVIWHYHSLSPDGKKAFLQAGKSIKVFDIDSEKIISVLPLTDYLNYICSSFDAGKVLTISGNNDASIWEIASGKKIVSLKGFTRLSPNFVYAGFSPDLS